MVPWRADAVVVRIISDFGAEDAMFIGAGKKVSR
jgi:hypothetical protein